MNTVAQTVAPPNGSLQTTSLPTDDVQKSVLRYIKWLEGYGEVSYDFQSYYSSDLERAAKRLYYKSPLLGTIAVSPMVFSEATNSIPRIHFTILKPNWFSTRSRSGAPCRSESGS